MAEPHRQPPNDGVRLSVIVASVDVSRSIDECLRRVRQSCAPFDAEIIVVDASSGGEAAAIARAADGVAVVELRPGTLVPVLWAEGYRRSCGRLVAFTLGQCLVSQEWASALVEALEQGAAGAGGPLVMASGGRPLDWAIFYLRYSAFSPDAFGSGRTEGEIAGDNAAYRREILDRHAATFGEGFWEVDFHRRVRAGGGWLAAVPRALVEFAGLSRASTIVGQRFAHGRHSGASRARTHWRIRLIIAAPLVPFVLAMRAAARIRRREDRWRFLAALPWFLVLASVWAFGEACGALTGSSIQAAHGATPAAHGEG